MPGGVRHALCNAHHLRELKALIDIDKEQWAGQMRDLLLEANGAERGAAVEGAAALPTPVLRTLIKRTNAIPGSKSQGTDAGSPSTTCAPRQSHRSAERAVQADYLHKITRFPIFIKELFRQKFLELCWKGRRLGVFRSLSNYAVAASLN